MSRVHSPEAGLIPTELVAQLEAATAGSLDLDRAILARLGFTWRGMAYWNASNVMWCGPVNLPRSIDAALALTANQLPGWTWLARSLDRSSRKPLLCFARVASPDFDAVCWTAGDKTTTDVVAGRDASSHAASPALALCAAVMKATTASAVGISRQRNEPQTPPLPDYTGGE